AVRTMRSRASSVAGALDRVDRAPTPAEGAAGPPLISGPRLWLEDPDVPARRDPSRSGVAATGARCHRGAKSRSDLRGDHDVCLLHAAGTSPCGLEDRGSPAPEDRALPAGARCRYRKPGRPL